MRESRNVSTTRVAPPFGLYGRWPRTMESNRSNSWRLRPRVRMFDRTISSPICLSILMMTGRGIPGFVMTKWSPLTRDSTHPASLQTSRNSCQETRFTRWRQEAMELHTPEQSDELRMAHRERWIGAWLSIDGMILFGKATKPTVENSLHEEPDPEHPVRYSFRTRARRLPEDIASRLKWTRLG